MKVSLVCIIGMFVFCLLDVSVTNAKGVEPASSEFQRELKYCLASAVYWSPIDFVGNISDSKIAAPKIASPNWAHSFGKTLKYEVFEGSENQKYVVFPEFKMGDAFVYGFECQKDFLSDHLQKISLTFLKDSKKVYEGGKVELPNDWYSLAKKQAALDSIQKSNLVLALKRYIRKENKLDRQDFYIGPFTDETEFVHIYWVQGKKLLLLGNEGFRDSKNLLNVVEPLAGGSPSIKDLEKLTGEISLKRLLYIRNVWVSNCVFDGFSLEVMP